MRDNFFDFMSDKEKVDGKIATSGNLAVENLQEAEHRLEDKMIKKKKKVQSNGPSPVTDKIRAEARKLAESSAGLDIAAFQRKHNIQVMNVEELLKG